MLKKSVSILFLVCAFFISTAEAMDNLPQYNLSVSFDIEKNLIKGSSSIFIPEETEIHISTKNLKIISVMFNGETIRPEIKAGGFPITGKGIIEIVYEGIFKGELEREKHKDRMPALKNIIGEKGIYLTEHWYPSIEGLTSYRLKATLPKDYTALSEAEEITISDNKQFREYTFTFPHPVNKIHLFAGHFAEVKDSQNGIDIYGYSSPEDRSYIYQLIEDTKGYLEIYEKVFGPYPYKRLSIVESHFPPAESVPTLVFLNQGAVLHSLSDELSLSHMIMRQWFQNLMYIDSEKGNWSEALITYLAHCLYEQKGGNGWQWRKKLLIEYQSYATSDRETALNNLIQISNASSKAIGYGKGAMVFHMLKNLIGEETFFDAVKMLIQEKAFHVTSWDDIRSFFERVSTRNLEWFFSQWLNRKGTISIEIKDLHVAVLKGIPTVTFEIIQKEEPYMFPLSVKIKTNEEEKSEILNIEKKEERFEIATKGTPLKITFDEDYNIMRRLTKEELPPVIARFLGDEKRLVIATEGKETHTELVDFLKDEGFVFKEDLEITDEEIKQNSLLVLGSNSPILKRLFGGWENPSYGFTLIVKENPLNTAKVVAVAASASKEKINLGGEALQQLGGYSFARFEKGRILEMKINETEQGMNISLYKPLMGIQPKKNMQLDEIIDTISDKPIIYIGERHTNYEDHKMQLDVIMKLYNKGRKLAIGMEMFQRPFQEVIDDYLTGKITEREFLKATQYYKRWQFDYSLYREIIEFAKAKSIPVVALNLWSEIVGKVSKEGLDSLIDVERGEIPQDMDMSDDEYKERLKEIFIQHKNSELRNFDFFYQSQILWDETMAHAIDEFLEKNPDYQIVVLAGVGHIMYGSGIPKRAYRLNEKDYVTLIPGAGFIDEEIGDYVLFPEHLPPPLTLKLGIILKERGNRVKVEKVIPGSVAKNAGVKKDDILISLDDWHVEDIADVRIFMFDKKQGDTIKIKVVRKKFLFGYKILELTTTI